MNTGVDQSTGDGVLNFQEEQMKLNIAIEYI